ncbi:MAK10-like protein [Tanacetum coccineum]
MEDPGLFTLPCRLGDSKSFDTLADLGSCVNIIPLYLFKKLNIELLEETDHIFGLADRTKSYPVGIVKDVEVHIGKLKLLNDIYVIDIKKDLKTSLLVGRGFLATANAVIDCRKAKITGSTTSSSSTLNMAFVSSESTSSTNDVSTAYGVSTSSSHNSQREGSSSYTDELIEKADQRNQEDKGEIQGTTRYKEKTTRRRLKTGGTESLARTLSQTSAKDKSGLGYKDQIHEGVLSYENEVLESVFDSRSSDVEDSPSV